MDSITVNMVCVNESLLHSQWVSVTQSVSHCYIVNRSVLHNQWASVTQSVGECYAVSGSMLQSVGQLLHSQWVSVTQLMCWNHYTGPI